MITLAIRAACGLDAFTYLLFVSRSALAHQWWSSALGQLLSLSYLVIAAITAVFAITLRTLTFQPRDWQWVMVILLAAPSLVLWSQLVLMRRTARRGAEARRGHQSDLPPEGFEDR
jgi:hypothetical protein